MWQNCSCITKKIFSQYSRSSCGPRWGSVPSVRPPPRNAPSSFTSVRFHSADTAASPQPQQLFLWLGDKKDRADVTSIKPSVLFPPPARQQVLNKSCRIVFTVDEIVEAVDQHYKADKASEQFVGGMGEQDLGVWFAPLPLKNTLNDPLLFSPLIRDAIEEVRYHRHGIPFGLFTTGCILEPEVSLLQMEVDVIEVSLFGSTSEQYHHCTGRKDFTTVCTFIGMAAELGLNVDVSVAKEYATAARGFAKAFGVRKVHVYEYE